MSLASLTHDELKDLIREIVIEVLQARPDLNSIPLSRLANPQETRTWEQVKEILKSIAGRHHPARPPARNCCAKTVIPECL